MDGLISNSFAANLKASLLKICILKTADEQEGCSSSSSGSSWIRPEGVNQEGLLAATAADAGRTCPFPDAIILEQDNLPSHALKDLAL